MSEVSPIPAGGAEGVDPAANPRDIATIRRAMKCWPRRFAAITEERKRAWVEGLDVAAAAATRIIEQAQDAQDAERGASILVSVAKTGTAMEALNQHDEELAEKYARIDAGQAVEATAQTVLVYSAPPPPPPAKEKE